MITKKSSLLSLALAFCLMLGSICRAAQEQARSVPSVLADVWQNHPFDFFQSFLELVILSFVVVHTIKLFRWLLKPSSLDMIDSIFLDGSHAEQIPLSGRMETELKEAADPFLHGFVEYDHTSRLHLPIGKNQGQIVGLHFRLLENMLILGSDGMRKLSGTILPMIQDFIRWDDGIIIYDDLKGRVFKAIFPLLKALRKPAYIFDIQNLDNSPGFNVLKSVETPFEMRWLANIMSEGAGYTGRMQEAISAILAFAFSGTKEISEEAALKDALLFLENLSKSSVIEFLETIDRKSWRIRDIESLVPYIEKRWGRLQELSVAILTPYAEERGLNQGLIAKDVLINEAADGNGYGFAMIVRPAPASSPIAPIAGFFLWRIMTERVKDKAIVNADIPGGYKTIYDHMAVMIADISPFKLLQSRYSLNEWVGTAKNTNSVFVINEEILGARSPNYVRYCKYFIATGGVDEETARALSKKLHSLNPFLPDQDEEKITVDEIMNIDRKNLIFFGYPERAYEHSGRGAFRLQKLYYKDNPHAEDLVLDVETGRVKTFSIEDYSFENDENYEPVSSKGISEGGGSDDL